MSKPAGSCIFCSGGKLSKEHIFPVWMEKVVPILPGGRKHSVSRFKASKETFQQGKLQRAAPFRKAKLRVVCRTCNNGWMSKIQIKAKPALSRMMLGDVTRLHESDAKALTRWVIMTVMVGEFADLPTQALSREERRAFSLGAEIDTGWNVFAAITENSHAGGLLYHAGGIALTPDRGFQPWLIDSMQIGKALFHAVKTIPLPRDYANTLRLSRISDGGESASDFEALSPTDAETVLDKLRSQMGFNTSGQPTV